MGQTQPACSLFSPLPSHFFFAGRWTQLELSMSMKKVIFLEMSRAEVKTKWVRDADAVQAVTSPSITRVTNCKLITCVTHVQPNTV
jgi:hypothetical protein